MGLTRPGKHTKNYWKWLFMVYFPIENGGSFHSYGTVYQRVSNTLIYKQSWFMIHENFWFLMAFYLGLLNRLIGQTAGEVIFICNLERFWHLGYFFIWEHHWSVFMFSINHSIKYITWTPLLYFNTTWIEWFIDIGSIGLTQWQFLALGPWSSSNFRFDLFVPMKFFDIY